LFPGSWSDLYDKHFGNCPTLLFLYKLTVGRVKLKLLKMKKIMFTAFAVGLSMTANVIAQVPSYVPSNGLVGWWPFNGNADDESGNGNNGTVNGATLTTDRFGNTNQAYSFDGNDWIELNLLPAINNSNELAVSVWVKSTGTNSNTNCSVGCAQYYFSRGYDGGNGFNISTNQGNTPYFAGGVNGGFNGGQWAQDPNNTLIPHSQWNHLLLNYDGINIKLYVNGSLVGTTPYTTNVGVGNTTNAVFGRQFINNYSYFAVGKIDDGAIWNRALSQQEISDLYNANNCSNDLTISPTLNTQNIGGNATFTATTTDPSAAFTWQSDLGQGFQTLNNYGNYSGVNTNTLTVSNVQLANHNQPIRAISTSGNCVDTSDVAVLTISNTCTSNVTIYDTVTVNETIYDTVTTNETIYDTLTTNITVYDTLITNIYDTTYITVIDTLIINTTLSLPAPNNENTILIYPNPASDHITIDNGNYTAMAGYTIKIENNAGQQVFQSLINQAQFYVDLSTWSGNGLYFVHLIDAQGNTVTVRKIVLQ
jgi:hypothetical protein